MKRITLSILLLVIFNLSGFCDGVLLSWGMNDVKGMTKERFDNCKSWNSKQILDSNLSVITWADTYLVAVAASQKKDSIIDGLIAQLTNRQVTKLQLTSRLIIWERILSDDILFEGKGYQVNDDLFSAAGRANWVLRVVTRKDFGHVTPSSTMEELQNLQKKWADWRSGKTVPEYTDPYKSESKGLSEIHSLTALEALIYSLKPSAEKDAITKNCLKKLYGLDELPKEQGSPASLCSPDTHTLSYLGILTDSKADPAKDYEWWKKWWTENKSKLKWDSAKAVFRVG